MPETQSKTETHTPYQRPQIIIGGRYQGRRVLLSVEKVEQDSVWYRSLDGHMSGVCTIETFLREYILVYDPLPDLLASCKRALTIMEECEADTEGTPTKSFFTEEAASLRTAISKAEGR